VIIIKNFLVEKVGLELAKGVQLLCSLPEPGLSLSVEGREWPQRTLSM
jgi:hypothetical protein